MSDERSIKTTTTLREECEIQKIAFLLQENSVSLPVRLNEEPSNPILLEASNLDCSIRNQTLKN